MKDKIIDWWNKNFSLRLELTERIVDGGKNEAGDL